uniref:Glycosyltransferase n=1 Tax=Kalopanax septemlobus TaxID=228393 RepID=A0A1Y0BU70_KALSE|nr:uridine diphosphate glycosyltransferase 1 [Kalopanax septemlobus]
MGHLPSMLEMAKILITRYETLSITVLLIKLPFDSGLSAYIQSLSSTPIPRLTLVELPQSDPSTYMSKPPNTIMYSLVETQKIYVRDIMQGFFHSKSTRLAGFFIDMFCVTMIDLAAEFKVPIYVFFAASAAFLGLMFYVQTLSDEFKQDVTDLKDSDAELLVPSLRNPFPCKLLPSMVLDKQGGCEVLLSMARRFRETKGIIVNTFVELESHAIESLIAGDSKIPTVYPVGPVLNCAGVGNNSDETAVILRWLDDQPVSSVVFLCFGSMGGIANDQVKEIAFALERSGHRFLWSLKPPLSKGVAKLSHDNSNLKDILPVGFLERTAGIGKVIGWAPQVVVLSHAAVGGFVSHCGWNSILESVWFGVPLVTWPLYAEQQLNAFEMVIEYGMALDIKMDYRYDADVKNCVTVQADEIESKIRELMMDINRNELRKKVKDVQEKSRNAILEKGSSYVSIGRIMEEII